MTVLDIIKRELKVNCADSNMTVSYDLVNPYTTLDELGVDSLRAITIMYAIEDETGVEIPNDAIEKIRTVGDIIEIVESLVRTSTFGAI